MHLEFDKIIFTGNIIRFNPNKSSQSNQNQNILWLYNLCAPQLRTITNKSVETFLWREDNNSENNLYNLAGKKINLESYLDIYLGKENASIQQFLVERFSGALAIGFELPPFIISIFNEANIPYIDIILGPIRFFPDLVPSIRSNVPEICTTLSKHQLKRSEIDLVVGWRKAFFEKSGVPSFSQRTILIAGQTAYDTSQIHDGEFTDILEFENVLRRIGHNANLLFKPHPYCTKSDLRRQLTLMRKLDIPVDNRNVYQLLNARGIEKVVAISSSVTVEARYFGLESETFIDYPFPLTPEGKIELDSFYNSYNKLTDTHFWAELLDLPHSAAYSLPEGSLASSLGHAWGASIFQANNEPSVRFLGRLKLALSRVLN